MLNLLCFNYAGSGQQSERMVAGGVSFFDKKGGVKGYNTGMSEFVGATKLI